jgi:hypothetical protein
MIINDESKCSDQHFFAVNLKDILVMFAETIDGVQQSAALVQSNLESYKKTIHDIFKDTEDAKCSEMQPEKMRRINAAHEEFCLLRDDFMKIMQDALFKISGRPLDLPSTESNPSSSVPPTDTHV